LPLGFQGLNQREKVRAYGEESLPVPRDKRPFRVEEVSSFVDGQAVPCCENKGRIGQVFSLKKEEPMGVVFEIMEKILRLAHIPTLGKAKRMKLDALLMEEGRQGDELPFLGVGI